MSRNRFRLPLSGLAGTTVCNIIVIASGIGSGATLARSLGPAGRGELAAALLWPGILVLVADMGLGFALSYYAARWPERLDELWTVSILAGLLLGGGAAVGGWFMLPHLGSNLQGAALGGLRIGLLSVPIILVSGYEAYILLGNKLVADYNVIRLVSAISYLLAVGGIAWAGWAGVVSYASAYVIAQAAGLLVCTALVVARFHPKFRFRADLIPVLFSYGFKTQLSSLAGQANLRMDQAIMSLILAPEQLGEYVVAVAVSGILGPFLNALAIIILPGMAHSSTNISGALLTARLVKIAACLSLPVLVVCAILMPWCMPFFFGRHFEAAVRPAQVLLLAGLFQGLNAIFSNSLRGLGHPFLPAAAEGIGFVVTCFLLYTLLPAYGIMGAAIASLVTYAAVALMQFSFIARVAGLTTSALALTPLDFQFSARSRQALRALVSW